jgi:hypothetical protein
MNDLARGAGSHELWSLLAARCDGTMTPRMWERLNELLRDDQDARRVYILHMDQHAMLLWRYRDVVAEDINAIEPADVPNALPTAPGLGFLVTTLPRTLGYFSSDWSLSYLIATVVCGIAALIGSLIYVSRYEQVVDDTPSSAAEHQPEPLPTVEPVGRITGMVDCKWVKGSDPLRSNDVVSMGKEFRLESGLMEIGYDTGAKVILQGPVAYVVESKNGGFMSVGKLTGKMTTASAKGFSVRTPTATITDLGTEFGVEVYENNTSDVYVLSGTVDVVARHGNGRQRLQANNNGGGLRSARVEADGGNGSPKIVLVSLDPSRFPKIMPRANVAKRTLRDDKTILVESRFNLSTEGWTASDEGGGVTYARDAGNPGGCIETGETPRGADAFYFISSPMFSGNRLAAFGGQLTFDVFTAFVNPEKEVPPEKALWMEPPLVILRSRDCSIATDLTSRVKFNQWNSMTIPLNAAGKWYRLSNNRALEGLQTDRVPVSGDAIRKILSDLDTIWIRAEYLHGYDIGRLDNVLLVAPDSPVSGEQRNTSADSMLEPARRGKRVLDAAPQKQPHIQH